MNIERQKKVDQNKRWIIIALNSTSIALAHKIEQAYRGQIKIDIQTSLKDVDEQIFRTYSACIYIIAMGIVVRHIAPYIRHKQIDPAVICIQSLGEYVIPVLSGHLGGANALAVELAEILGAKPIITTASDLFHATAMDLFAEKHQLVIDDFEDAKTITALLIEKKWVELIIESSLILDSSEIKDLNVVNHVTNRAEGLVIISNRNKRAIAKDIKVDLPNLHLIPQNLVIGIGCKKNTSFSEINNFLKECLEACGLDQRAIGKIASIELKKDEAGILQLSRKFNISFITYSQEDIKKIEKQFPISAFVKETIGVGSVSMPAGFLASKGGRCLMQRKAYKGITLSIWEESLC
jgi:cobalt-precorrin 5A hydrolase